MALGPLLVPGGTGYCNSVCVIAFEKLYGTVQVPTVLPIEAHRFRDKTCFCNIKWFLALSFHSFCSGDKLCIRRGFP